MAEEEKIETAPQEKKNGAASPIVLKLRKPVIANGDETSELTFREPTAADIEIVGNPVNIDFLSSEIPKTTFDGKAMTQMLARLAGVPPSTIRQMHTKDWNDAAWSLWNFFTPGL